MPSTRTATSRWGDAAQSHDGQSLPQSLVANGYYDLATPYLRRNTPSITSASIPVAAKPLYGYYEAGHMMYIHQPSLRS